MRHDYDLPPDWASMTDAEKSRWMTQERCRRQAKQQATATAEVIDSKRERAERILKARGYYRVEEKR